MPEVPWVRKSPSIRSEKKAAKLEGGRRTPMSGAGRIKGDVQTTNWLIEDKITHASSFRLTRVMFAKTIKEAFQARKLPQWRITIMGQTYRVLREQDYLAMVKNDKSCPMPEKGS